MNEGRKEGGAKFRRLRYVQYGKVRTTPSIRLSVVNGEFINRLGRIQFLERARSSLSLYSYFFLFLPLLFLHDGGRGGTKEGRKGVSRRGKYTHAVTVYGREVGRGERLRTGRERERERESEPVLLTESLAGVNRGLSDNCIGPATDRPTRFCHANAAKSQPAAVSIATEPRRETGGDGGRARALARSLARSFEKKFQRTPHSRRSPQGY